MKIMHCPLNGPRNIAEFAYGGEVVAEPADDAIDDAGWAGFVFLQENRAGVTREWWCHVPSAYWFVAERDRLTGEVIRTFPASALERDGPA